MTKVISLLLLFLFVPSYSQRHKHVYCAAYRSHFEIYCRGIWSPEKLLRLAHHLEKIERFCPNYKRVCFRQENNGTKRKLTRLAQKRIEKELKYDLTYDNILERLSNLVPCTPDCHEPHCTEDCKCEYDWPTFQKFCYPPTLKEFISSCSNWFDRCPNFEKRALEEGGSEKRVIVHHPPLDVARREMYNMMG